MGNCRSNPNALRLLECAIYAQSWHNACLLLSFALKFTTKCATEVLKWQKECQIPAVVKQCQEASPLSGRHLVVQPRKQGLVDETVDVYILPAVESVRI